MAAQRQRCDPWGFRVRAAAATRNVDCDGEILRACDSGGVFVVFVSRQRRFEICSWQRQPFSMEICSLSPKDGGSGSRGLRMRTAERVLRTRTSERVLRKRTSQDLR
ncbi:hypothetical protein VIGAN_06125800 [Vigna angularis var. angularis]|uniref:Uncharacterized protein n=1 Tax=Vigna angularis var. angularis TaxID=157739 RepID=A0A0S3SB99_PHAAN|nr:hypothetical protein VIGAN_06125800 [Vigna angularis var. angularis]